MLMIFFYLLIAIFIVLVKSVKQIQEYERGVKFQFGKYSGIMEPGWRIVWPVIQGFVRIDLRVKVVDVPDQDAITRDNVSVKVNAVLYFEISRAELAVLKVESYHFAVSQLAQTTMRDVVGEVELDELLTKREEISQRIKTIVDKASDSWGIRVNSVDLKHIELPGDMQRTIAKQAEAERERRAVIIKAKGDRAAAEDLALAAKRLAEEPGALHLRTLQSINDLSSDKSNTVVFVLPLEVLRAIEGLSRKLNKEG